VSVGAESKMRPMLSRPPLDLFRPVAFVFLVAYLVSLVAGGSGAIPVGAAAAAAACGAPALGVTGCGAGCEEDLRGYATLSAPVLAVLGATRTSVGIWAMSGLAIGVFLTIVWLRPASIRNIAAE